MLNYIRSYYIRWIEFWAKHMLPVVITNNYVIGNIHEAKVLGVVLVDVQVLNGSDTAETSLSIDMSCTVLNDLSLAVLLAGITSSSLTSLLTWDITSNWPGMQLWKKVIVRYNHFSLYQKILWKSVSLWKFKGNIHKKLLWKGEQPRPPCFWQPCSTSKDLEVTVFRFFLVSALQHYHVKGLPSAWSQ